MNRVGWVTRAVAQDGMRPGRSRIARGSSCVRLLRTSSARPRQPEEERPGPDRAGDRLGDLREGAVGLPVGDEGLAALGDGDLVGASPPDAGDPCPGGERRGSGRQSRAPGLGSGRGASGRRRCGSVVRRRARGVAIARDPARSHRTRGLGRFLTRITHGRGEQPRRHLVHAPRPTRLDQIRDLADQQTPLHGLAPTADGAPEVAECGKRERVQSRQVHIERGVAAQCGA